MNFNKLTEIAFALCDFSSHDLRAFHVSFLLRRSKILSIGINKKCTHTINLKNRKFNRSGVNISDAKFKCAEFCCLWKSKKQNIDYHKCKLVVIRITRKNKLGMSAPCESCLSLLRHFNIKEVYFTTESGEFVQQIIN